MTNGRSICQKEKNCLRTVIIKTQIIVKKQKYTIKTFLLHTCIRTKILSVPESAHCFSYGFMITRRRSFFFPLVCRCPLPPERNQISVSVELHLLNRIVDL